MRHATSPRILFSALLLCASSTIAQTPNAASWAVTGHRSGEITDAPASLAYNEAGKVWILTAYKDRHRVSFFFSKDFTPSAGTFPVKYQYRNEKNAMGGSVHMPTGEGRKTQMYSHETEGEVTFSSFDARAVATFEFKTYDSWREEKNEVTARGRFDVAVPANAFQ